ncbi:MAG: type 1 periplasmic binding fold superfamily protein, partial [Croceitalea sp.]|nr:type 1 periplasmic binding fold superfamily protein [Croceitalea sp.]
MKTIKFLSMLALSAVLFTSCSDDDETPEEVNEEEVITTM